MTFSKDQVEAVVARADDQIDASLDRLLDFMRIQSVSTDSAYAAECRRAADFMVDELKAIGFDARTVDTIGHPMVVGHHAGASEDAPHILFYGHYDVQPVDPIELWNSDPFDPKIETRADGSKLIRGRGASDDKAQLKTFIEACRHWKDVVGALPCRVTVFLEGEEESGSKSMAPFLAEYGEELKADYAMMCDTSMWDRDTPAITIGLRGMAAGEVVIKAASRDLHSGLYGSAAANPITLLVNILADLKDADGRVTLPGFYDGVPEVAPQVKATWDTLGFDEKKFLGDVGLSVPAGEKGRSVLEQTWARPTAEINGIIGGYTGEGFKTVIPAEARAKVSFRLVGEQDNIKVWESFKQHVLDRLPADCEAEFIDRQGSKAVNLPLDNPGLVAAAAALADEWGKPTPLLASGGSIPIAGDMKRVLGMDAVLVGFALEDDMIHSPNEKYELKSFHKGIRSWVRILAGVGAQA